MAEISEEFMRAFITGAAGFIGYHVAQRLLAQGHSVVGYDALTPYYDPVLKQARLDGSRLSPALRFTTRILWIWTDLARRWRRRGPM